MPNRGRRHSAPIPNQSTPYIYIYALTLKTITEEKPKQSTTTTTTTTTMGKQKQQVISRFFAPKPQNPSTSPSSPSTSQSFPPNPPTPPPKTSATVTFSPSKRLRTSQLTSPRTKPSKIPKLSPQTHNHVPSSPNSSLLPDDPPPNKPNKNPKLSPHTHNPIPPLPNPSLHQRFLKKLLEPSEDILEPSSNPSVSNPKYTPLEQQVLDLKDKYPDVLLMVEVGYKYRFFGDDAENAARVLGIFAHMDHNFLTASIPTFRLNVHVRRLVSAGFKVGVVKQTETAAIKAHGSNRLGPFCRGLSALYTKATMEVAEDVGGDEEGCGSCSNYLVCVVEKGLVTENMKCGIESGFDVKIGIVAVEISTGDVVHGEFNDNFMRAGLEAVILSLSPAELLLGEPLSAQTEKLLLAYAGPASNVRVECASRDCFKDGGALAEVMSLYEDINKKSLADHQEEETEASKQENNHLAIEGIMAMPDLAVQALAITIRHLKQFGFERILCLGASFRSFSSSMEMTMSANALQQLEVLKNNSDGSESGSLLQCMNHTLTIFGSRLLRHWVTHPLCDRNTISARLDAVSEIAESMGSCEASQNSGSLDLGDSDVTFIQPELNYVLSSVLITLGRLPDIQRGITRIFHRTATTSEFVSVIQAILVAGKQLQQLHIEEEDKSKNTPMKTVRSVLLRRLILTASSSSVIGKAGKLLSTLNKEAAAQGDLQNLFIISSGQFPEVARVRTAVQLAKENLDSLIGLYRKQLKMHKLEFISVSGTTHLIELPSDIRVPSNWVKVNSTKKTIRYHPPEVLTALDQSSLANEELLVVCRAAWDSFLKEFGKHYAEFQSAVQALAALDCLHSLATLSRNKNYVRPFFVNHNEPVQIHIRSGRHPVMETILQDNFVPNDTNLHAEGECCQIVTGPNMGGKSCYIRQVALIAIMAQVGSFVPASSAKLHVLDGIHTRMGASDSIQRGSSTFLEELSEASHIVHKCTERSLVIIDELGRGTSTHDGVAIAYATLHHLLEQKRCMVLFVTHYPKIIDIKKEFPGSVGAYYVSYLTSHNEMDMVNSKSDQDVYSMDHEDVTYLYKLVPGVSERSFGFKVSQLAQLPSSCIRRAIVMASKLEAAVSNREKDRLALKSIKETLVVNQESAQAGREIEDLEELTDAYREFFSSLNSALGDDDLAKSWQLLKHARSIGMELINR
ncbi:DNA mismatch repair protein MSH3 isoform X2 [Cornus florida]|uniref:DNA mismatch repair protein MSH3 isoform X2 n=1 Tax=Cornus florida TaxID=4283 RepID=UPI00289ECD0C|nr:DNA mismatch repair protein MSH3 isoform X2 [Cornus florida]